MALAEAGRADDRERMVERVSAWKIDPGIGVIGVQF
jgi:hypothetical protein